MSAPDWRRKGATLIELMAATSLSLLALSVLAMVIVPAFKSTGQSGARIEMQEQAAVVMRRLTREVQRSMPEGLGVLNLSSGSVLSIHSIVDLTGVEPPTRIYSKSLVFYVFRPSTGCLTREVWPDRPNNPTAIVGLSEPDGTRALRPSLTGLRSLLVESLPGQRLATQVKLFQVQSAAPSPAVASPVTIHLELERQLPGRDLPSRFKLSQVLSLRNSE